MIPDSSSANPLPDPAPDSTPVPEWKRALDDARLEMQHRASRESDHTTGSWPENSRLVYLVDLNATTRASGVVVDIGIETVQDDGSWSDPQPLEFNASLWLQTPNAQDRHIAALLLSAEPVMEHGNMRTAGFVIGARAFSTTLRAICDTGRCISKSDQPELSGHTLRFDAGPPWRFRLSVLRNEANHHALTGVLVRVDDERTIGEMAIAEPEILHAEGLLLAHDAFALFDHRGAFPLANQLRNTPALALDDDLTELLERVHALPNVPEVELPGGTLVRVSDDGPTPSLTITSSHAAWTRMTTTLKLEFLYGAVRVGAQTKGSTLFDREAGVIHHRQLAAEELAYARLFELGAKKQWSYMDREQGLIIPRENLTQIIATLAREGWRVEADGLRYRVAGEIRASIRSGVDWFDLDGTVRFGDTQVSLASLLEARRMGRDLVLIDDGSMGLMPTDWLERLGPLVASGESVNGATRFRKSQALLLDALLASLPDVDVDQTFAQARKELAGFESIQPIDPPATFHGVLREYQREGLGWLHFLRQFQLGGCLADDMGLGKTIQVLALLDARRENATRPSIIVVPRSLVFNWLREAERFTPELRILDHSVSTRTLDSIDVATTDVVVTTYGTLRRDAALLGGINFDYAILDEAQAIKNAGTATAKACRLLRAQHRLALTGTPIENRIEELWSLLEFLNPGMLGPSAKFAALARFATPAEYVDEEEDEHADRGGGRTLLARALKPVILRRTKEKVASELPPRVEQTLEVELEPKQRTFYDGLRERYRQSVLSMVERDGMQKSRMHILEALLRLRQAACHPSLADPTKHALPSAKLDALVPALLEIAEEGHKSLVFSQFTQFLSLVRERLDAAGMRYEYLDGKTRDRQERVDRFQTDPDCRVFLISLKAGGQGLNLTAADYVYLLDPWWNPAVEAQAIDRAHRIGQFKRVIATRLVARDTIEEKILQLQASKRALADAILTADKGVLASIGRTELEELLG